MDDKRAGLGVEEMVTDDDRETLATEFTSEECDVPVGKRIGVSPPNAEAMCRDWEHLGG
ncbi:MAG: hypothetical protein FJZ01_14285 [Candidatus Sericytochromatia bacterium]|nr:hypothetical protein [Candidatus Tanganyikabacteria bacterium]